MLKKPTVLVAAALSCVAAGSAFAQDNITIPRAEWEKFLKEHEEMKRSLQELRDARPKIDTYGTNGLSPQLAQELDGIREMAKKSFPGSDKMLLTGYGTAGYTSLRHQDQFFSAQFNPIL